MARKSTQTAVVTSPAQELMLRINTTLKADLITLGNDAHFTMERVPTGSLVLDRLTGGGFARGRHVVLYGDWSVAKSLTLYRTLALAQQRGETTALIDAENAFNSDWFEMLGGDPANLALYPDRTKGTAKRDANELGNVLKEMIDKSEGFAPADIVGIDSVASLLPNEELEHDLESGDVRVASLARLMPLLLRSLTTMNDKTLFIWTNQWRDKISRIPNQKSQPGGRALGFFASTRIEMSEGPKETGEQKVIEHGKEIAGRKVVKGRWVNCTLTKEKTGARPYASRSFLLDFETRMPDPYRELIDLGMEDGLIELRGQRYYIPLEDGDEIVCHGIPKLREKLATDDELRESLTELVVANTMGVVSE